MWKTVPMLRSQKHRCIYARLGLNQLTTCLHVVLVDSVVSLCKQLEHNTFSRLHIQKSSHNLLCKSRPGCTIVHNHCMNTQMGLDGKSLNSLWASWLKNLKHFRPLPIHFPKDNLPAWIKSHDSTALLNTSQAFQVSHRSYFISILSSLGLLQISLGPAGSH